MKYEISELVIRDFLKHLKHDVRLIRDGFHEEVIHKFRVEVKKLRAFIRMLRQSGDKIKYLKFPPALKTIYLVAGEIRDRQLCIKRLRKYRTDAGVRKKISSLKNQITQLKKEIDFPTQIEYQKIRKKLIGQAPSVVNDETVKKFFRKKLNKIKSVSRQHVFTDVQLHSVRKWLKDIGYVKQILDDRDLKTRHKKFVDKKKMEKAEKLSQSLGLFNDVRNAVSFLKITSGTRGTAKENFGDLTTLRKNWLKEKGLLKRVVGDELRDVQL